jgi:hypothetical protein
MSWVGEQACNKLMLAMGRDLAIETSEVVKLTDFTVSWLNGTRELNGKEQQLYLASFDSTLRPEELPRCIATKTRKPLLTEQGNCNK